MDYCSTTELATMYTTPPNIFYSHIFHSSNLRIEMNFRPLSLYNSLNVRCLLLLDCWGVMIDKNKLNKLLMNNNAKHKCFFYNSLHIFLRHGYLYNIAMSNIFFLFPQVSYFGLFYSGCVYINLVFLFKKWIVFSIMVSMRQPSSMSWYNF